MNTEARWIHEKARLAEQQQIRDGEELFVSDLVDILSPAQVTEGVSIDFGTNGELFRETLDTLGLHTAIDTGRLHIRRVMNFHSGVSNMNSAIAPITGQNLYAALALMQTDQWATHKDGQYGRTELTTPDALQSMIVLASPDREHDGYSDLTQPIVTLSARYRYAPEIDSAFTGYGSAAGLVRQAQKHGHTAGEHIGALAESLRDEEAQLLMPGATFRIEMGMHESAMAWSMAESARVTHAYAVQAGRIIPSTN